MSYMSARIHFNAPSRHPPSRMSLLRMLSNFHSIQSCPWTKLSTRLLTLPLPISKPTMTEVLLHSTTLMGSSRTAPSSHAATVHSTKEEEHSSSLRLHPPLSKFNTTPSTPAVLTLVEPLPLPIISQLLRITPSPPTPPSFQEMTSSPIPRVLKSFQPLSSNNSQLKSNHWSLLPIDSKLILLP